MSKNHSSIRTMQFSVVFAVIQTRSVKWQRSLLSGCESKHAESLPAETGRQRSGIPFPMSLFRGEEDMVLSSE